MRSAKMPESPYRIEPCLFDAAVPNRIADLVGDIRSAAGNFGRELHPDTAREAAGFVRIMNSYYSNLIEGHNTRPLDIERALAGAEIDPERRELVLEAKAHITVQQEIEDLHNKGMLVSPVSPAFLSWAHRRFFEEMPQELRIVERPGHAPVGIVPGQFRSQPLDEVTVGRHTPPSAMHVSAFLAHFMARYEAAAEGGASSIIAIAAAHHRLNYIHPFMDGNGRVSRLVSHAMSLRAGIGASGLWSISRGLARGLNERSEYKRMMDHADSPRRGDFDGRGNLSLEALTEFCIWFLSVVLDQITFTARLFDLEKLKQRYARLMQDAGHSEREIALIIAALRFGDFERGVAHAILQTSERTARTALGNCLKAGFLASPSPKGRIRVALPMAYRERLFPNLFAAEDTQA
jgi:Fic family protein